MTHFRARRSGKPYIRAHHPVWVGALVLAGFLPRGPDAAAQNEPAWVTARGLEMRSHKGDRHRLLVVTARPNEPHHPVAQALVDVLREGTARLIGNYHKRGVIAPARAGLGEVPAPLEAMIGAAPLNSRAMSVLTYRDEGRDKRPSFVGMCRIIEAGEDGLTDASRFLRDQIVEALRPETPQTIIRNRKRTVSLLADHGIKIYDELDLKRLFADPRRPEKVFKFWEFGNLTTEHPFASIALLYELHNTVPELFPRLRGWLENETRAGRGHSRLWGSFGFRLAAVVDDDWRLRPKVNVGGEWKPTERLEPMGSCFMQAGVRQFHKGVAKGLTDILAVRGAQIRPFEARELTALGLAALADGTLDLDAFFSGDR